MLVVKPIIPFQNHAYKLYDVEKEKCKDRSGSLYSLPTLVKGNRGDDIFVYIYVTYLDYDYM